MTRQHFEAIANTIANLPLSVSARESVAVDFADMLVRYNPTFKRAVFLNACQRPLVWPT